PLPVDVDAAAPLLLVVVLLIRAGGKVEVPVISLGLVRTGAESADLVDQQAADRQRVVADHLGRQAKRRLSGVEPIGRIVFPKLRSSDRRLLIGAGADDEL